MDQTAQDTLAADESIHRSYRHGAKIVRVAREGQPDQYRWEEPMRTTKDSDAGGPWEDPELAELYADVWTLTGFREEKTGRRGVPPAVVAAGREETIAYQSTLPGVSTKWLTRFYDMPAQRIYEYRSRVRARAEEKREELAAEDIRNELVGDSDE